MGLFLYCWKEQFSTAGISYNQVRCIFKICNQSKFYFSIGFEAAVFSASTPITLYRLVGNCSGSVGAAILGAKAATLSLDIDYKKNSSLFYTTSPKTS